ncbi:MAG TPA: histidine phosphatase family protein [Candidatus Paceibacterota bacterium]
MKTIYFVRHGESESNIGGVILGGAKTSLTKHGQEQAAFVAERLSHLAVDVIIASTYLRTRQTGQIIAEKIAKPIEYSDLFVEWNQGSHRIGKKADDLELGTQTKTLIEHLKKPNWRMTDEENFEELNKRADRALAYLMGRPEEHIVVVGHGWFSPVLLGKAVMGEDFTGRDCQHFMKAFRMVNTGITIVTHGKAAGKLYSDEWNIVTWNDHAHLG